MWIARQGVMAPLPRGWSKLIIFNQIHLFL